MYGKVELNDRKREGGERGGMRKMKLERQRELETKTKRGKYEIESETVRREKEHF